MCIFFVISGFLLYRPFVAAHLANSPKPRLSAYFVRRLVRIVPAYWLALTVSIYFLHVANLGRGWQGVALNYGFAEVYDPTHFFTGLGQAWTLCTEMSFYLALPLFALLAAGRRRDSSTALRREVIGIAALVALSVGFQVWTTATNYAFSCHAPPLVCVGRLPITAYTTTWLPYSLELFATGMLLATASVALSGRRDIPSWLSSRWLPPVSWGLALGSFLLLVHLGTGVVDPRLSPAGELGWMALEAALGGLLVLPAAIAPLSGGIVRGFLASFPLAALGTISYGVYLWHLTWIEELVKLPGAGRWEHEPLGFVGFVLLVTAASVAAASASWFLLERPILRLVHRRPHARFPQWPRQPAVIPVQPVSPAIEPFPAPLVDVTDADRRTTRR